MVLPYRSAAPNTDEFFVKSPAISLPKGGGAIRGIGEKFTATPVTGTGNMTIPIALTSGRSDFGPQLSLSYDSAQAMVHSDLAGSSHNFLSHVNQTMDFRSRR